VWFVEFVLERKEFVYIFFRVCVCVCVCVRVRACVRTYVYRPIYKHTSLKTNLAFDSDIHSCFFLGERTVSVGALSSSLAQSLSISQQPCRKLRFADKALIQQDTYCYCKAKLIPTAIQLKSTESCIHAIQHITLSQWCQLIHNNMSPVRPRTYCWWGPLIRTSNVKNNIELMALLVRNLYSSLLSVWLKRAYIWVNIKINFKECIGFTWPRKGISDGLLWTRTAPWKLLASILWSCYLVNRGDETAQSA
jgi:hypothetical protein